MPSSNNERRHQVFVSSTFLDLQVERQKILQAVLQLKCFPDGMELFPSADDEQWSFIKREIDLCDYYIIVVAGKYGSLSVDGRSFTEKEYDYAEELHKPIMAFLHEDLNQLPWGMVEQDNHKREKLNAFRDKLKRNRLVSFYKNPDELQSKVLHALGTAFESHPRDGWTKGKNQNMEGGLVEFRKSFEGLSYERMLRESVDLFVVMNDGRSWIDSHREALQERSARTEQKTTFVLLHPKSDFISILLRKNHKLRTTQIDEIRRSFEIINGLREKGAAVEIMGHHLFNPYSMFLGDQQAIVMPYFLNEAGQLPVCIFQRDDEKESLYWRYKGDVLSLLEQSEPLTQLDFG